MRKVKRILLIMFFLISMFLVTGKISAKEVTVEDLYDNYLEYLDENSGILDALNMTKDNIGIVLQIDDNTSKVEGLNITISFGNAGFLIPLSYNEEEDTLNYLYDDSANENSNEELLLTHLLYTKLRLDGKTKEEAEAYINGLDDIIEQSNGMLIQENDILTLNRQLVDGQAGGYYLSLFKMKVGKSSIPETSTAKSSEESNPKTSDSIFSSVLLLMLSILAVGTIIFRKAKKSI